MAEKLVSKKDQAEIDLLNTYQRFFQSEDGKTIIYDLMKKGYFLRPTLGKSPEESSRNEGQREILLYILAKINEDPAKLLNFILDQQKIEEELHEDF